MTEPDRRSCPLLGIRLQLARGGYDVYQQQQRRSRPGADALAALWAHVAGSLARLIRVGVKIAGQKNITERLWVVDVDCLL